MTEETVKAALKVQELERETYRKRHKDSRKDVNQDPEQLKKPRWIGDILVEDFGLSEKDRKRIVKKQMKSKIDIINLKLDGNIQDARRELIHQLDSYFQLTYSKNRVQAHLQLNREIPSSMTINNVMLWLYSKNITYGIITAAIGELIENKIKPGKKIMVAKGVEPVSEQFISKINFKRTDALGEAQTFPLIVTKHSNLLTLTRIPGESGFNVHRGYVLAPKGTPDIVKGPNVVKKKNSFLATCDGVPTISDKGVLSVSPTIVIPTDLSCDSPAINHDCDVDVHGMVDNEVKLTCRKLTAVIFKGHVSAGGDVTIKEQVADAKIISKGSVTMPFVLNSSVTGEKSILIDNSTSENRTPHDNVSDSTICCNDFCILTSSKLFSSTIQAKNKIILRKTIVRSGCKLIVGDSVEVSSHKKAIEDINAEIKGWNSEIQAIQEKMRVSFEKLEKKDISDIKNEIDAISRRPVKTKIDMDRIRELKKKQRKLERESKKEYDEHGDRFIGMSNRISDLKKRKINAEEKKRELGEAILTLYKKNKDIPVIDAQKATLSKGLIIQFRHAKWELDDEYAGYVFREEYNKKSQKYEIKKHRW